MLISCTRFVKKIYKFMSWLSYSGCLVLKDVYRLFCLGYRVLAALSWQILFGCLVLCALSRASCPGSPVLVVISWQSCPGCLFLAAPSWLSFPDGPVLSLMSCPNSPLLAFLSWKSSPSCLGFTTHRIPCRKSTGDMLAEERIQQHFAEVLAELSVIVSRY
jgi:hypothetical protein